MKIANIGFFRNPNIGDQASSFSQYISKLNIDLYAYGQVIPPGIYDLIIVGGGLFPYNANEVPSMLKACQSAGARIVGWGIGGRFDNTTGVSQESKTDYFDAVYYRETGGTTPYAPCISCLSHLFDKYRETKPSFRFVFFLNSRHVKLDAAMVNGPIFGNHVLNLEEVIAFLASGDTVVTASYHGMYWAALLGKKIIALDYRHKMHNFPWNTQLLKMQDFQRYLDVQVHADIGVLEEARMRTGEVAKEVLGIELPV